MPEPPSTQKPPPKTENLVVALLPPWQRSRVQALLERRDAECARVLGGVILQENARTRLRAAVIVLPVSLLLLRAAPITALPWYVSLAISLGLTLTAASALTCLPSRLEKAALETLAHGEDLAYIGPCLEVLQKRDLDTPHREQIQQTLARLLPRCTLEIFEQLTTLQRRSLYGILNYDQRESNQKLHLTVLNILQKWGDRHSLGVVYRHATGEGALPVIQASARECVEQIGRRLDFGDPHRIPIYTEQLWPQLYPKNIDIHRSELLRYQDCAVCIMALRRLLPQLTPDNVKSILTENQRVRLYQLLAERTLSANFRYGKDELFLEIITMARRLRDTQAIRFLKSIASTEVQTGSAKRLRAAARETLQVLETYLEKEKESRILLRGAAAPDAPEAELLRAAAPAPSAQASHELLRPTGSERDLQRVSIGSPTEADVQAQRRQER